MKQQSKTFPVMTSINKLISYKHVYNNPVTVLGTSNLTTRQSWKHSP